MILERPYLVCKFNDKDTLKGVTVNVYDELLWRDFKQYNN